MKVNEYLVLSECVEAGITRGYTRAFKHEENPDPNLIKERVYDEVMMAICEHFTFDGDDI